MEGEIARLLPEERTSHDRSSLLDALASYSAKAVWESRLACPLAPAAEELAQALVWLDRPVFVCGHHRTGTTLLLDLLDGHPELRVLPNEGTYLTSFDYAARDEVSAEDVDRFTVEWIARFIDPNAGPHFLLGRSVGQENPAVMFARRLLGWNDRLREAWPTRGRFALLLALVAAFGDMTAPAGRPRMWVEKTPLNERNVKLLSNAFSQARFIQMVREPLATMASVVEAYRGPDATSGGQFRHAWAIRRSFRLAIRNRRRLPSRYLVVSYEDLCRSPADEMGRVRAFLEISPSASLTTPTVLGRPVSSNSSFQRGEAGVVVPPREAARVSDETANLVRAVVAAAAATFGYEFGTRSLPRRTALLLGELPRYLLDRVKERARAKARTRPR